MAINKNVRMNKLVEVRQRIANEVKRYSGTFSCLTLYGEKKDYDFTVTRKNGTRKNLKVYTASEGNNTALSEHLISKPNVSYVVLCSADDDMMYVFDKKDVLKAGNKTKDGRIHFSSVINNMDDFTLLEAKNNFKRVFLEY